MALKSAPYYWLECDGCGELAEYDEFSAFKDVSTAIDRAEELRDLSAVSHRLEAADRLIKADENPSPGSRCHFDAFAVSCAKACLTPGEAIVVAQNGYRHIFAFCRSWE